ncbi:class I SAM-dependent methyltransferase [Lutibacter sp. HS1-25]|uniref:O-methyltransferase n=1 Tax=Lutibacter sp. HS1-25 TaxID=2485000 RepID=UPI00101193BD|nr:class I SAM-dependent methyltransferase [Lutibacter sp. HS1-25]RXP47088.1 class I SAM-dependent methyltransferase [Lutibacter sp. HS1-25]
MWFKIKSYFHFLIKSTNQHGVHSPFVYHLVTNCFYKKTNTSHLKIFKKVKNWLHLNKTTITVSDFGKGSKVFKSNQRKVAEIAKIAGISNKKAFLLMRICTYFNFENILEIGTSVGLGTAAISIGNNTAKITTLEGCKNTAAVAQKVFEQFNFNNIKCIVGNFDNTLPLITKNKQLDLVYFDGNHQKEPTLNYFNECLKAAHNNTVFIFDDINWTKEMQETWEIIKNHPKVSVTIDTYFWGFVFFRKEQKKEHFTIRI